MKPKRERRRAGTTSHPELDEILSRLLEETARLSDGENGDVRFVREILVSALGLMQDGTDRADLKIVNAALKELRKAFRVFGPYSRVHKVAVFGSARTPPEHPAWKAAHTFADRICNRGWMVITGAGDGIMGAAQGGAGRDRSFGVNIRLPFEQSANEVIAGDPKLIPFKYFFSRKLVFLKEAHAVALFPGGLGTHDEGFETLTLIQTGKSEPMPVVCVDEPGGSYWQDWAEYIRGHLGRGAYIDEEDLHLFRVTDDVDEALEEICHFYANYHSSRYVRGQLVIRVRHAPDAEQLDALNEEFAGILTEGRIEVSDPLPEEHGEVPGLKRLTLHFNRRDAGRLRLLIDALNDFTLTPEDQEELPIRHLIRPADAHDDEDDDNGEDGEDGEDGDG